MKVKVSELIADYLVDKGVKDVFMVTGGGAMHLNDALGHKDGLVCTYNHHEQACAIAAEGYARLTGKVAAVCVTSGPGGTNAITGVVGAWQDSIPMFVISGQVKRETTTWSTDVPLRQLGDQEFQIVDMVSNTTKYSVMVTDPNEILYHLEKAWILCNNGRKGPVWLDIPLDVQATIVDTDEIKGLSKDERDEILNRENPHLENAVVADVYKEIKRAMRPVILGGTGINVADARDEFLNLAEVLNIPVVTAWNAHDIMPTDHRLFVGKPGTVGTRPGNFVIQSADLVLVLGCRLNIRMISYNRHQFAEDAIKIVVDIDKNELKKPTVRVHIPVNADVKEFMKALADYAVGRSDGEVSKDNPDEDMCLGVSRENPDEDTCPGTPREKQNGNAWLARCKAVYNRYPAVPESYHNKDDKNAPLNPYVFSEGMFKTLDEGDVVVTGNGSACVIGFQASIIKKNQRLFTNSGCAAMGYGFPAAIGAAVARGGERVICYDGDGSFMMNLQELQTVAYHNYNLKIVILNNNGYHSIRQTQTNLFKGRPMIGVCADNGVSFPEFEKIAYAFGIPYYRIDSEYMMEDILNEAFSTDGACIIEAVVDPGQNFEPKLSSKINPDGTITSPPLDDMFPFLPEEEYRDIKDYLS